MHVCHLILKHCIYIFEFFRKILMEIQQYFDESELTEIESLSFDSKESKLKSHDREILVKPCN
jgi:hypothetical protein